MMGEVRSVVKLTNHVYRCGRVLRIRTNSLVFENDNNLVHLVITVIAEFGSG